MMKYVQLLMIVPAAVQGAVWNFGSCPDIRGIENFDLSKYTGVWYEYANVFEVFQIGGKCVRATYTLQGNEISVKNEAVNTWFNRYQMVQGTARPADPASPDRAELYVSFPGIASVFSGNTDGKVDPNYNVVCTDYDNYAVVYSCSEVPFFRRESLWVLTREQKPDSGLIANVYSNMTAKSLPVSALKTTDQDGCDLLPPVA